eukprot:sb/3465930/
MPPTTAAAGRRLETAGCRGSTKFHRVTRVLLIDFTFFNCFDFVNKDHSLPKLIIAMSFALDFAIENVLFVWLWISTVIRELIYMVFRNRPRKEIKNSHILITGTAQGIGKEIVSLLACDGNTLHLVDVNTAKNDLNKADFADRKCTIYTYTCDISSVPALESLQQEVKKTCPKLDYLINNAGVVVGKLLPEESLREMAFVMNVNAMGAMNMTKLWLDDMIRDGGHVVFVSSIAGLVTAPFMTSYAASKHAVTGFARCLQMDLDFMGISKVKLTTVFPHFTDTGMFNGATVKMSNLFPLLQPSWVADQIVTAMKEERDELILPRVTAPVLAMRWVMECRVFRQFCTLLGNDLMKTFRQTREHKKE